MVVKFYTFNWLTASAGVGLIKALKEYGLNWQDYVKGNVIEFPEGIAEKLGDIYANYLVYDLSEKILDSKNILNSIILRKIEDFYENSILTNPSTLSSWKKKNQEEFRNLTLEKAKELVRKFINDKFSELLSYPLTEKKCFFCNERYAYEKNRKPKTFGAENFTPLSASSETAENFFYNGRNTIYLCAHCEIFLFFSAFGFTKTPRKTYLFVYVPDLTESYRLNDKLQIEKNISADWLKESVLEVVKDLEKEKAEWLYQNIYVVEIEKADKNKANVYSFSIPLRITRAIKLFIDKYPPLLNDIFPDFLDYIYSEKNLYELLFKILVGYFFAESKYSGKVNDKVINFGKNLAKNKGKERKPLDESILYLSKFQEVLNMNEKEKVEKQIDWAYSEGLRVKERLEKKYNEKAKKKIEGISYKILDAIRRRDIDAFQQNLIRAYLEVEREIPYVFVEALKEENFNRVAYAFLVGLNGRKPEGTS